MNNNCLANLENLSTSLQMYERSAVDIERGEIGVNLIQSYLGGQDSGGIIGLGYDRERENLWMCLDQSGNNIKWNEGWNTNTILTPPPISFKGVEFQENGRVKIDDEHPVSVFAQLLGKQDSTYLTGEYNDWEINENSRLFSMTQGGLEGIIGTDFEIPNQVKIAIPCKNSGIFWDDNGWYNGKQRLFVPYTFLK